MRAGVQPPIGDVRTAVARALEEDLTPLGDITSALLPEGLVGTADFVVRTRRECSPAWPARPRPSLRSTRRWWSTGRPATATTSMPNRSSAMCRGRWPSILTAERTALNFLGHLSGIATLTRELVDGAAAGGCSHLGHPQDHAGLRALEKAAVRAGGGVNHRGNLSDWILLKDNHLAVLGIEEAVRVGQASGGRRGRSTSSVSRSTQVRRR